MPPIWGGYSRLAEGVPEKGRERGAKVTERNVAVLYARRTPCGKIPGELSGTSDVEMLAQVFQNVAASAQGVPIHEAVAENMAFGGKIWMNMLTKVWRKPAMHSNPAVYRRKYCRSSMTRGHFPSTKQCRTIPYSVMSNMQNHCF